MNVVQGNIVMSFFVLFTCVILFPIYKLLSLNLHFLSDLEACPHCVGSDMCILLTRSHFSINWTFFLRNLANNHGSKQLFFGTLNDEMVVIKKFPDIECATKLSLNISNIQEQISSLLPSNNLLKQNSIEHFKICPSVKNLNKFILPIIDRFKNSNPTELYWNIIHLMKVNVEPILQQALNGWAIAEHIGCCGKLSVSKYGGSTLTSIFPTLDWEKRNMISQQLLQLALNATFEHPYFAFYFTDFSPDNVAVSPEGIARLIDLEDVIMVDKFPADPPDEWYLQHQNYHDDNVSGFAFSTEEVCSHQVSDLNIYAVCQGMLSEKSELLSGGLLHNPPKNHKYLRRLVKECVSPNSDHSRISIATQIINVLKDS